MTLHTGFKIKTSKSISGIEDWLEENCKGEWDLEIETLSTELNEKVIAVYFESDQDHDAFKAAYKYFT